MFERLAVPIADQLPIFTAAATGPNVVHSGWGRSWSEGGTQLHDSVPYPIFKHDGTVEIDNNAAQRRLRVVALGRKNYLFAGSNPGGERAAAICSLLGTAKLNGINPE